MKGRDESPLPFREEGWERGNHAPCPSQLRLASKLASLRISPLKGREPILLMPLSACPPAHRRAASGRYKAGAGGRSFGPGRKSFRSTARPKIGRASGRERVCQYV